MQLLLAGSVLFRWPNEQLVVKSLGSTSTHLGGSIAAITLVGYNEKLTFTQEERGLVATMPDKKPRNCAYALNITWK